MWRHVKLQAEEARQSFEYKSAKDDETKQNEPEHGNGRLGSFLGALLDLLFGLASAGFLVLDELGVAPSLLEGLGHCDCVS